MESFSKKTKISNPYVVLGVDRKASLAEIKRAYFKLVREYPPEDHPEQFKEIRNAYERLKSPEQRAALDLFLLQPPPVLPEISKGRYDLNIHSEDIIQLALELRLAEISFEKDFRDPEISQ